MAGVGAGAAGRGAEAFQPGAPLAVVGEEPVHIGAGDAAIGRDGAVRPAVGEVGERPGRIGAFGAADMHFIAGEG